MENNNSFIKKNSELRRDARAQLSGNWGTAILLFVSYAVIASVITGIFGIIPANGYVLKYFIQSLLPSILIAPLTLGLIICFLNLVRNEPFIIEKLFDGLKIFLPAVLLQLLITIATSILLIFFIVPGVIAGLAFSMSFYILNDNPEMSAIDVLKASNEMMKGYKLKLFFMCLVFFGFILLSAFTLFIGLLWLVPYMYTSLANFYQNLKDNQKRL